MYLPAKIHEVSAQCIVFKTVFFRDEKPERPRMGLQRVLNTMNGEITVAEAA